MSNSEPAANAELRRAAAGSRSPRKPCSCVTHKVQLQSAFQTGADDSNLVRGRLVHNLMLVALTAATDVRRAVRWR